MYSETQFPDDPTATYRGYRRQALYCLFRLFDDGLPSNSVIQPEGNEDLAVRNDADELLEAVQVKDYTANLTASAFKPSFYRRVSVLCKDAPSVTIKVVSFGPIGPELRKACDNSKATPKRALETLTKEREEKVGNGKTKTVKGLGEKDAAEVFTRIILEEVDEATLTEQVIAKLASTMTSGNPSVAFENLMWWLIASAEEQSRLTRTSTIEKIVQLGQFLTHRNAHQAEWNVSIKPIEHVPSDEQKLKKLASEFFRGGRVRSEHVAAGLDVPRHEDIDRIHKAFQAENVVILRAASGQGKTTLAFRYLLDWAPADFRFQVARAADLEHARRMAIAVAGHSEIIEVPTVVYLDVSPGDNLWVEFVRELAGANDIRVLVTIREEDWFRSRVTHDDFSFADIPIHFTEDSGQLLFAALRASGHGKAYLDFADAWAKLGVRKTLFEFVYLVTQNEKLSEKISAQITALQDDVIQGKLAPDELNLLRLVAVASAYEARLDLKRLADFVEIAEPARTLQRFSNEYLLRTSGDGKHVEGFHAIRSEIIAAELTDTVLQPRGGIEAVLPGIIAEDDLESFLLCSFSRNESAAEDVIQKLHRIALTSWVGVRAVLVAVHWLGLKRYACENADLIDEVRFDSANGWWLLLDWDLAQTKGQGGFGFLRSLADISDKFAGAAAAADAIQQRQSDKNAVFTVAVEWLQSFCLPENEPDSVSQFVAMGEVLYWLGHLEQSNPSVTDWLNGRVVSKAWEKLPDHLFARFASGIQRTSPETYASWLNDHRDDVVSRLRQSASIIALVEEEDCLTSHFVIDLDREASALSQTEQETSINDLAVERVDLVSAYLRGFRRYGASGYGHRMSLFDGIGDESTKRMPLENIPPPWLPDFNALARGVVEYQFRPNSWDEYFERVRHTREKVITVLDDLRSSTKKTLKDGKTSSIDQAAWDECRNLVNEQFFVPQSAVDEWGFVSESRAEQSDGRKTKRFSAISTLDPFNKAISEYTSAVGNFLNQSHEMLVLVPAIRGAKDDTARKAVIAAGKKHGVNVDSVRLSVANGMDACTAVRALHRIERSLQPNLGLTVDEDFRTKEIAIFVDTMRLWSVFCFPEQMSQPRKKPTGKRKRHKTPRRQPQFRDCLTATANRINHALKQLKPDGIIARIIDEDVCWDSASALWITFDTHHPLGSLVAVEKLWHALVEALSPDRQKIVRIKAIDLFWHKIVVVPLVQGRSIDRQAYPEMNGASFPLNDAPEAQLWRFAPQEIPAEAWKSLGLSQWDRPQSRDVFDKFALSYGVLFHHVDHIADFTRCKVDLDEVGEEIFLRYLRKAVKRVEPFLQETFDTCAALLAQFPELDGSVLESRPNIQNCMNLVIELDDAIMPSEDFDQEGQFTIDELADWRNRLKDGLNLVGEAQALWIADSLGIEAFDYTCYE